MVKEQKVRIPSPAKAAIAQQKPRDATGRFLSGAALQNYQVQQQQAQFAAERDRVSNLLGRSVSPVMPTQTVSQIPQTQSTNFEAIINANKPRGMASTLTEDDKWAILLGKKRSRL